MKSKNSYIFVCASLSLSACKAASTSECLSTSSGELTISEKSRFVQGGYVHFGDKACSATFDVVGISSEHIRLRAYSARHCRFENGLELDKVSVSLHFTQENSGKSGYVKQIPVSEKFVDRATQTLQELKKINSPKAEAMFLGALRLPTQFDPWFGNAYAEYNSYDSKSSLICKDYEQIPPIPDPQNQMTDSCWSFLDLGTYDIVIRKSSLPAAQFSYLTQNLGKKARGLADLLNKDNILKSSYYESRKSIDTIMSLLRSHQAAQLASLLNFNLCQENIKNDELCKNQAKLIEIMAKYFVENDETGAEKNIFDWIHDNPNYRTVQLSRADLLGGKRVSVSQDARSFADLETLTSGLMAEIHSDLKTKSALHIIRMREIIAQQSRGTAPSELSPSYVIGTNFVAKEDSQVANYRFGLFGLNQIFNDPKAVRLAPEGFTPDTKNVHGVSKYGTMRIAFPYHAEVVKFQPTDSGSLITLDGIIPLMVLNTVNDEGTSGGSAILALPEIGYDDESISPNVAQPSSSDSSKTVSVRVNDASFSSTGAGCF